MKSAIIQSLTLAAAVVALAGCKASSPPLTGTPRKAPPVQFVAPKPDPKNFEKDFTFKNAESSDEQKQFDQNVITVNFQVSKDGQSVNGLSERDFHVSENGTPVSPFKIDHNSQKIDQVADIVFIVDITNSMSDFLESAKLRLKEFIVSSKGKYHIRMCLSKFGDLVVKKCDRFFDNANDGEVAEFINELTDLSVHPGQGEIAGHLDNPENSMRAVVEAANSPTPWGAKSQRFAILVTDADFYSPDKPSPKKGMQEFHQANPDTASPTMAEVHAALKSSGMQVFPVTMKKFSGYNSPLAGQPGIAQSSGGKWFDFNVWRTQHNLLNQVFDEITNRINTTYTLTYIVDKVQGLDPTLVNDKRQVQIETPAGMVAAKPPTSNKPEGRPEYKQIWKVSDSPIQPDSMQVQENGKVINANEYSVRGGEVRFNNVPQPGTRLHFSYLYESIEKNMRMEPINIPGVTDARTTKVYLNGKEARSDDIRFDSTGEGSTNVTLNPSVMAENDPYGIRAAKGVKVRVVTNYSL